MKLPNTSNADIWKTRRIDLPPEALEPQREPIQVKVAAVSPVAAPIPAAPKPEAVPSQAPATPTKPITISVHRMCSWGIPVGLTFVSLAGFFFGRMSKEGNETTVAVAFLIVMIVVAICVQRLQKVSVSCPLCGTTLKHGTKSALAHFICEGCGFQAD